jgi:hypothetical protein
MRRNNRKGEKEEKNLKMRDGGKEKEEGKWGIERRQENRKAKGNEMEKSLGLVAVTN